MFYDALATAIENAGQNQLDECSRQISRAWGGANLTDDQAEHLYGKIHNRRGPSGPGRSLASSIPAIAPRYYIQRSPDQHSPNRRASFLRRRTLAGTGPLPPHLMAKFTTGEQAALKIVADEYLARGACSLGKNEIGARAGVSKTVVKRALRLAERLSMVSVLRRPRSGRKHLTNITKITQSEWLTWLEKGNRRAYAIKTCNQAKPILSKVRGVHLDPPRAQSFKEAESDPVDKSPKKWNRTVPGRHRL